jgi:hypothetical protein
MLKKGVGSNSFSAFQHSCFLHYKAGLLALGEAIEFVSFASLAIVQRF